MTRWAAYLMIAIGLVHLAVLGRDAALPEIGGWLAGGLWSIETIKPLGEQSAYLVRSGHAFWATIGNFAVPFIILGWLILWVDSHGIILPRFVGWAIAGWSLLASLGNQPSGFPIGIAIAVMLLLGARRQHREV